MDPLQDLENLQVSITVGNASDSDWTDVYDSMVFHFPAGIVKPVKPIMGPELGDFGAPKTNELIPSLGPDGMPIKKTPQLFVKAGGSSKEIVAHLLATPGSPIYLVIGDQGDVQRRAAARKNHRDFHMTEAQNIVERHRAQVKAEREAGLMGSPMPAYVRTATKLLLTRESDERQGGFNRYVVVLDNNSFDFLDDVEAYIRNPMNGWAGFADKWHDHYRDMNPTLPHAYRAQAKPDPIAQAHAPAPEAPPAASETPVKAGPSAAVTKILKMAEKNGIKLPNKIVKRLDDPNDENAVEDAMDLIMASGRREPVAQ
jgi:hypothetical protein